MTKLIRVQDSPQIATPLEAVGSFAGHPSCVLYTNFTFPDETLYLGVETTHYPPFPASATVGTPNNGIELVYNDDPETFFFTVEDDNVLLHLIPGYYFFSWHINLRVSLITGDAVGRPYAMARPHVTVGYEVIQQDNLLVWTNETNQALTGESASQEDSIVISGLVNQAYGPGVGYGPVLLKFSIVPMAFIDTFRLADLQWIEGSFRITRLRDQLGGIDNGS